MHANTRGPRANAWGLEGARGLWDRNGQVLILDTKHGTNCFGLKLALLVTVDQNGTTRILTAALLRHEDAESFSWILGCFERALGKRPGTLFTDSDPAMAAAAAATWPGVVHLLCTWHLFKVNRASVASHLRRCFIVFVARLSLVSSSLLVPPHSSPSHLARSRRRKRRRPSAPLRARDGDAELLRAYSQAVRRQAPLAVAYVCHDVVENLQEFGQPLRRGGARGRTTKAGHVRRVVGRPRGVHQVARRGIGEPDA